MTTNIGPEYIGSPFARTAQRYIDNSLSVIPVAPGSKMPGAYVAGRWRGMNDWPQYSVRLPTEMELDIWQGWPDAGIGLLLGPLSNVIAADVDTEDISILKKINGILPPSPVRKKGKKGYTSFFRYNGEVNKSWRINGKPVIDLLSEGRQTLMPGTIHPDGMTYIWLTEDTIDKFDVFQLPTLPENFNELMAGIIEPLMSEEDRKYLRNQEGPQDSTEDLPSQGFAATYFRDINTQALYRLDEWVPKMIPTAKPTASGYRCKAFWRNAENLNVGITRQGIRDFGGDYGMTAIDLVMYAQNVPFNQAAEALRAALKIVTDEPSFQLSKLSAPLPKPVPKSEDISPKNDLDPMLAARNVKRSEEELQRQEKEKANATPDFILQAPGMLGRIAGWMAETAPKYQPELFVAAAIAAVGTAMGRLYRTDLGNWTNVYIVMVAKTGEGKEHPQQCVARILASAGLDRLVAGAGYTSPGAVHSALLEAPSHIVIIDEMGKLLKFSRQQGSANSEAAIDKLVEAFGRTDGFMKPPAYSTMNLSKKQRAKLVDKTVHNPAITMLGATTPATFYESLTSDLVGEGFLGRLIVVQSKQGLQIGQLKAKTPPPEDILTWIRGIHDEGAGDLVNYMNPAIPAVPVVMTFDPAALELFDDFEHKLTFKLKPKFEAVGMAALLVRSREKAMRVAMIVAKAVNHPGDNRIYAPAVKWAIDYVEYNDLQTIHAVQTERGETLVERQIKKVMAFIARAKTLNDKNEMVMKVLATGGMPHNKLLRAMGLDSRTFAEVVKTAIEQGRICKMDGIPALGYAGTVYWCNEES